MQTMTRWTDGRMDDLSGKINETNRRIDELSREMHAEFRAVRSEMKMMQATMIGGFISVLAAMAGLFATQL